MANRCRIRELVVSLAPEEIPRLSEYWWPASPATGKNTRCQAVLDPLTLAPVKQGFADADPLCLYREDSLDGFIRTETHSF